MLGPTRGQRCLDLGSDNGVVSLLLREGGGEWASGDLTEDAVASIRSLVETDTHLVRGDRLPFPDATFDRWWWWTCWSTSPTTRPSRRSSPG